jgi:hypothetical protein
MKVNGKMSNFEKKVRLENKVVVFELSLEWSKDDHVTEMVM